MNVAELIAMLEKVQTKTALVFMKTSRLDNECLVDHAIIEHDLRDDEVVVILRTATE